MSTPMHTAPEPRRMTMFDSPEDRAAGHAYALLQTGELNGVQLPYEHRTLLRTLVECRGKAKAKSIGHLGELLKLNPRTLKGCVHDLRETFHVRIGSSRDGEDGGFYLITNSEEAIETALPLWNQAAAMMNVVGALLEPHELELLARRTKAGREGGR